MYVLTVQTRATYFLPSCALGTAAGRYVVRRPGHARPPPSNLLASRSAPSLPSTQQSGPCDGLDIRRARRRRRRAAFGYPADARQDSLQKVPQRKVVGLLPEPILSCTPSQIHRSDSVGR